MQSFVNRSLDIEGESGINLGGDFSWNDLQDLTSELNQETVECGINLCIQLPTVLLAICNSVINELGIFGFLGSGEDEGRIGGSVLGLVLSDCLVLLVLCSKNRH